MEMRRRNELILCVLVSWRWDGMGWDAIGMRQGTNDAKMGVGSFQTEDGSTTSISISNWGFGVEFANQIMKPRTRYLGTWRADSKTHANGLKR